MPCPLSRITDPWMSPAICKEKPLTGPVKETFALKANALGLVKPMALPPGKLRTVPLLDALTVPARSECRLPGVASVNAPLPVKVTDPPGTAAPLMTIWIARSPEKSAVLPGPTVNTSACEDAAASIVIANRFARIVLVFTRTSHRWTEPAAVASFNIVHAKTIGKGDFGKAATQWDPP